MLVIFISKIMYIHMNNKKLIRLTESDLHRIVKESVNKVLNEIDMHSFDIDDRTPQEITADERKDALYEKIFKKDMLLVKGLKMAIITISQNQGCTVNRPLLYKKTHSRLAGLQCF